MGTLPVWMICAEPATMNPKQAVAVSRGADEIIIVRDMGDGLKVLRRGQGPASKTWGTGVGRHRRRTTSAKRCRALHILGTIWGSRSTGGSDRCQIILCPRALAAPGVLDIGSFLEAGFHSLNPARPPDTPSVKPEFSVGTPEMSTFPHTYICHGRRSLRAASRISKGSYWSMLLADLTCDDAPLEGNWVTTLRVLVPFEARQRRCCASCQISH